MNIILGASGQVGSHIVKELIKVNSPVRAVVRNPGMKFDPKAEVRTADFFHLSQLTKAMAGGTTVFLLTPENPGSNDIIGETRQIIENYRQAIQANGIRKIVGLSSIGAHLKGNTGNFLMSRMLELGFDDLDVKKVFIRPSYFFSNWLNFLGPMEQYGALPTFFPEDMKIDMNSPLDVARFIANAITNNDQSEEKEVYELVGPEKYSSREVGGIFAKLLDRDIAVQRIPKEKWKETLNSAGFTDNTAANLMAMTQAVIDKIAVSEKPDQVHRLATTLEEYLKVQTHFT